MELKRLPLLRLRVRTHSIFSYRICNPGSSGVYVPGHLPRVKRDLGRVNDKPDVGVVVQGTEEREGKSCKNPTDAHHLHCRSIAKENHYRHQQGANSRQKVKGRDEGRFEHRVVSKIAGNRLLRGSSKQLKFDARYADSDACQAHSGSKQRDGLRS